MNSTRLQNEPINDYFFRICDNRIAYGLTWADVRDLMNDETGSDFGESKFRKDWNLYKKGFDDGVAKTIDSDETFKKYEATLFEIKKEKVKVQTEKVDLTRMIRDSARIELYFEHMNKCIETIKPVQVPEFCHLEEGSNEALLCIADAHFGAEFTIKGMCGEIINQYSPEIFEQRMWDLLEITFGLIEKNNVKKLNVVDLADALDGLIHCSQLTALRYGQTDAIMIYAEFMANWLNELSKKCLVEWRNIKGNHTETRPFQSGRGDFPNENGERLIAHLIKIRLKDNTRVIVHETVETPATYFNCDGFNIVACHGQYENKLDSIISSYNSFYNIPIDIVLMGHLHRNNTKTVSSNDNGNVEVVQCPSIVGVNKYAEYKKLSSKAGAKWVGFLPYGRQTIDILLN